MENDEESITDEEHDDLRTLDGQPEKIVYSRLGATIRKRLDANNDFWAGVTGPEGSGKSTLAMKLAEAVDDRFEIERNVIVNPTAENVLDKIMESDVRALVIDEAVNIAYNREHSRKENIFFARLSAVCRKKNKFVLLCIPRMRSLDSSIRNHRMRTWFFVPERGHCVVMAPNVKNPYCSDPWYLKHNEKLSEKLEGKRRITDINTNFAIEILRKTKTFWFAFKYTQLPIEAENKYKSLVEREGKKIVFGKESEKQIQELVPKLPPKTKYNIYKDGERPDLSSKYMY